MIVKLFNVSFKDLVPQLSISLMERLFKNQYGVKNCKKTLTMQYRMNELIMEWPSKTFYNNKLIAHNSVAKQKLSDLPKVKATVDTNRELILVDTKDSKFRKFESRNNYSFFNKLEAEEVISHVQKLVGMICLC